MKRKFVVNGRIQAKQRPRFNGIYTYTPAATSNYENWVKVCYLDKYKDEPLLENPLKVIIIAYYEIPKSVSKKKREQMLNNEIFPTVKPDTDNIAKSILDSLNKIAYFDDKQIIKLEVEKRYAISPYAEIIIEEVM